MNDRGHFFRKERRLPSEISCIYSLRTALYDKMKAGEGKREMINLKMNQVGRESNVI